MQRTLYFNYCQYDAVPLNSHDMVYNFFEESDQQNESVTLMSEDAAIRWLMTNSKFRRMFIEGFFDAADRVLDFYGLQQPLTDSNKMPGDIDLLLVNPLKTQFAIAFECKRVKAISYDSGSKVNNIAKIRHGIKQANAYRELGFHQTYLMIILLDDGRAMTTPNTMFRYGKDNTLDSIYSIPWQEPLHEDVGIVYVKVNQTTGKSISLTGGIGFRIDKRANHLEQSYKINTDVKMILANHKPENI
jgi:hypothetical protein